MLKSFVGLIYVFNRNYAFYFIFLTASSDPTEFKSEIIQNCPNTDWRGERWYDRPLWREQGGAQDWAFQVELQHLFHVLQQLVFGSVNMGIQGRKTYHNKEGSGIENEKIRIWNKL